MEIGKPSSNREESRGLWRRSGGDLEETQSEDDWDSVVTVTSKTTQGEKPLFAESEAEVRRSAEVTSGHGKRAVQRKDYGA